MKEIKFLLLCLAVALYTSSWWACAMFGWVITYDSGNCFPLRVFPVLSTALGVCLAIMYLAANWSEK